MKRQELYEDIEKQVLAERYYRYKVKKALAEIKGKVLRFNKNQLIAEKIYRNKIRLDLRTILEKKETVKYSSTGLNTLDDLFMNSNLLSSLETGFNSLTTSAEQRKDYKNHITQAIINLFNQMDVTSDKSDAQTLAESIQKIFEEEEPDLTINVMDEDELPEDKVVGPEKRERDEADEEEDDPEDDNVGAIDPNEDVTGRNKAANVMSKIEKSISDYYITLGNPADRRDYQIYMLANLEMYFKKWEDALRNDVTPESQPEVDQAIADAEAKLEGGDEGEGEDIEGGEEAEELDLDF